MALKQTMIMNGRLSSTKLQITREIYHDTALSLQQQMTDEYGIPFFIDWNHIHTDSCTHYSLETKKATGVIIVSNGYNRGTENAKSKETWISDYSFLAMVNSFFHEARHVWQSQQACSMPTQLGEDFAYALISENRNESFYVKDHYPELANETDADLYATKMMYSFLEDTPYLTDKGQNNLNAVTVDFMNHRICNQKSSLALIRQNALYHDWQEISDDINGNPDKNILPAYDRIQNSRIHGTMTYDILWLDPTCKDMIAPVFIHCPDLLQKLHDAPTIRDECRIMTSITCEIFPDLQSKFHALDKVDLSMKTVCGRAFTYEEKYVKNEVIQRYESLNENDISDIISTRILPVSDIENVEENVCEQMLID